MQTVPVTPLPLLSSLPAYADHFALGMGLAVVERRRGADERTSRAPSA